MSTELKPKLDRADWGRFGSTNTSRCVVCSGIAVVNITISATEKAAPGSKGQGAKIVSQVFPVCHEHGIMRYGSALAKLSGTN